MSDTNLFEVPATNQNFDEEPPLYAELPRRKRGRPRKTEEEKKPVSEHPEITVEELQAVVIPCMQILSSVLDESFNTLNEKMHPLPHVDLACQQMLPWAKIYGAALVKISPWFGLVAGCAVLIGPALSPTLEIISGQRKPRLLRRKIIREDGKTIDDPTDIYNAPAKIMELVPSTQGEIKS